MDRKKLLVVNLQDPTMSTYVNLKTAGLELKGMNLREDTKVIIAINGTRRQIIHLSESSKNNVRHLQHAVDCHLNL